MTIVRRIELVCGVLAGIAGLAGVWVFFYLPIGEQCSSNSGSEVCSPISYVAANGAGSAVPYWLVFGAFCLIVVLGAVFHSLSGRGAWSGALWTGAALLLASCIFGGFSIGLFLVPGALLALVAAILSSVAGRRRANATTVMGAG